MGGVIQEVCDLTIKLNGIIGVYDVVCQPAGEEIVHPHGARPLMALL
jgi:hypothetical protein